MQGQAIEGNIFPTCVFLEGIEKTVENRRSRTPFNHYKRLTANVCLSVDAWFRLFFTIFVSRVKECVVCFARVIFAW